MGVVVVSDAHVSGLFLFSWFCLLFCLVVWLITGCLVVWACFGVGWWLVAFFLFVGGRVCFVEG